MSEKEPAFVVVDRRKFTAEGEIRDTYTAPPVEIEPFPPVKSDAPTPETTAAVPPNVIAMPARSTVEVDDYGAADDLREQDLREEEQAGAGFDVDGDGLSSDDEAAGGHQHEEESIEDETSPVPPPSAQETAEQFSAYQRSARDMDALLLKANPGMKATAPVGFEHIVQSFYLSAIMAMGAGTEPGQKPRIDILGARQSIDMLTVLADKTRGNLDDKEQRLVDGVTFELRMMFLELTNAIAAQASPQGRR